jgi:hypothetical protein
MLFKLLSRDAMTHDTPISKYNIGHITANTHPGGRNFTVDPAVSSIPQIADAEKPVNMGNIKKRISKYVIYV